MNLKPPEPKETIRSIFHTAFQLVDIKPKSLDNKTIYQPTAFFATVSNWSCSRIKKDERL